MTNHAPTFTSSSANVSFTESANTTGSGSLHTLTGTMNFADSDHSDTHTTTATLKSAVWSGGAGIPAASLSDFQHAMSSVIQTDHNGAGTLKWTFSDPDQDFDFLAKNETLVLTYNITVSDNHGGSTTQTVKVTVTGTDDKPVINMETATVLTEQANHTLSLVPDVAHIALNFNDVDLDNTNYSATVTAVSATGNTSGILPGSLGTAELMAFYDIDNVSKAAGSTQGTINTTFAAPDLAFDYLAAGEQVNITYTVQLDDHAGGISTQTITVTVIGTNDKPIVLAFPESAHLVEGQDLSSGNLTAHGDFLFTDVDLTDTHTVSTTVTATRSSGGAIPLSDADLIAAMHTTLDDSTGQLLGDVDWNFALANGAVNFLSGGETLTLAYHITVTDTSGATSTEDVTITILGTNHPVVMTSGPESASLAELDATTGSSVPDTTSPVPTGTLAFSDPDLGDTHTVQVTVDSALWSGGPSAPAATQSDLAAALQTILHDSTGTGTGGVDWTFGIPDKDLDFLAAGETLTVTYDVNVLDATTSATQTVTITATGSNDAVLMTGGPGSASVAEQANMHGSATLDSTSPVPTGTLTFGDADLSDTHSVSVSIDSATWSVDPFFVPGQTYLDLQTALMTTLHDSTGTGLGSIDWNFAIPDSDLDFLAAGETLTVVYDVTVTDGSTSSIQTVTITATGAEDTIEVNPVNRTVADTPGPDVGSVTFGDLFAEGPETGGDQSNAITITEVNGSAANVGQVINGTYGSLEIDANGLYTYVANAAIDPLQAGDNVTDQFTFTVTDSLSHSASTTLTFNIVGADDFPQITSANAFGSITEDAGPTATINGGFETGDLTGWFATPGVSAQFLGIGGQFGNYAADLVASGSLEQDVATTAGQHYTLSFYVGGDADAGNTSFTAYWDGVPILTLNSVPLSLTHYTFDVVGDAIDPTTQFFVDYSTDGSGLHLDELSVNPTPGPATETADGSVSFSDIESGDVHTASFSPQNTGYVGTFSLDPVSESGGAGSVGWHFTVDNADIQFLSSGETLTQTYTVFVDDGQGGIVAQDVSVALNGTNDAPTTVGADNVITDGDANGAFYLPGWTLTRNDTDPDHLDTLSVNAITGQTGLSASVVNGAIVFDDGTLGGSFTYNTTDGMAVSGGSGTVTVTNNSIATTLLNGTSGDDIIVATVGGETLSGGDGNDILIGNGGTHTLTGGSGNDIFAFQVVPDQGPSPANVITDFDNVTDHDMVAISAAAFGAGLTVGMDASTVFESSADAEFFGHLFHYDETGQILYFSSDGTTANALVVAQFQPSTLLTGHDLMIV